MFNAISDQLYYLGLIPAHQVSYHVYYLLASQYPLCLMFPSSAPLVYPLAKGRAEKL